MVFFPLCLDLSHLDGIKVVTARCLLVNRPVHNPGLGTYHFDASQHSRSLQQQSRSCQIHDKTDSRHMIDLSTQYQSDWFIKCFFTLSVWRFHYYGKLKLFILNWGIISRKSIFFLTIYPMDQMDMYPTQSTLMTVWLHDFLLLSATWYHVADITWFSKAV